MRKTHESVTDTRAHRRAGRRSWLPLSAVGLIAAVTLGLTVGGAGYEVDREANRSAMAPGTQVQCQDLDTGTALRGIGVATGCDAAPDVEVQLVSVCNLSNAAKRSPTALGGFGEGRFTTLPCPFGVRELFIEVDGVATGPFA